jgi:hypothetical protein
MVPTLNRYGRVHFISDRPDLQGTPVQVVAYGDGHMRLFADARVFNGHRAPLYDMPGAAVSYEASTRTVRKTPNWAIVVAIVGFLFVLVFSLLFLLVKETRIVPGGLSARFVDRHGRTAIVELR